MSPYLFVIVMDLLVDIIDRAVMEGDIKLHHRCKDPVIIHLSFADDLIGFLMEMRIQQKGFGRCL